MLQQTETFVTTNTAAMYAPPPRLCQSRTWKYRAALCCFVSHSAVVTFTVGLRTRAVLGPHTTGRFLGGYGHPRGGACPFSRATHPTVLHENILQDGVVDGPAYGLFPARCASMVARSSTSEERVWGGQCGPASILSVRSCRFFELPA